MIFPRVFKLVVRRTGGNNYNGFSNNFSKFLNNSIKNNLWSIKGNFVSSNALSMENKKMKLDALKIGTHDGRFHCDEVLACYMLQKTDKYKDAIIIRSRDQSTLDGCDIVVDVGQIFDKDKQRFDHHQRSFNETFSTLRPELCDKYDIRLSSAGLIYTYFGEEVISNILKEKKNMTISNENLNILYRKIYENFIQEIDAIDNGVQICDGEPRYQITTHLSARVDHFNSQWYSEKDFDEEKQFNKAKNLVSIEFVDKILYYATSWLPAREIVESALKNAKECHESGEIIELSKQCPWKQHLFDLEEKYQLKDKIKYVILPSPGDDWRIICVPNKPNSFICRKFLHTDWRGLREEQLKQVSSIEDVRFCHSTGFIGGARSRESVLQMGVKSLKGDYVN